MKIFISSDMEGTAGVVDWDQVTAGGHLHDYYADLLTQEINAAIDGAVQAGATEFLLNDSHGKMANLRPDALSGSARYLSGRFKPMYMMQGLDASFDAVFFISYHGSMSSKSAALSHTYTPVAFTEVTINGVVTGEAGINALVAQAYGVPVVLVTGDDITAQEIEPFCPGVHTAVVKESVTRFAANSLHPAEARRLIFDKAAQAITALNSAQKVSIKLPVTLDITFRTSDYADLAERVAGVERTSVLTARIVGSDPLEVHRNFITVVLLCRGLSE